MSISVAVPSATLLTMSNEETDKQANHKKRPLLSDCKSSSKGDDELKRQSRSGTTHVGANPSSHRKAARTFQEDAKQGAACPSQPTSKDAGVYSSGIYAPFALPNTAALSASNPLLQLFHQQQRTTEPPAAEAFMSGEASVAQQQSLDQATLRQKILEGIQQSQQLQDRRAMILQQLSQQPNPISIGRQSITPDQLRQFMHTTQQQHQQQRQQNIQNSLFAASSSLGVPSSSVSNDRHNDLLRQLLRQSHAAAEPSASRRENDLQQLLFQQRQQLTGGSNFLQMPQGNVVLERSFGTSVPSITGAAGFLLQQERSQRLIDSLIQSQQQPLVVAPQAQALQSFLARQDPAPTFSQPPKELPRPLAANQQAVSTSKGIPLAIPSDVKHLSGYQIFIRHQLEYFVSEQYDCDTNVQGRKKRVKLCQIGIRCRHCAHTPLRQRGRGSVYYPQRLDGVYQAAQNMATTHLATACLCISEQTRGELSILHKRKDTAAGGKAFWADACRRMGMTEDDDGIHFQSDDAMQKALAGDFDDETAAASSSSLE